MTYSILEFDDYERAPEEPHRKFAVLEQSARRRMNEIMDSTDSSQLAAELRNQYMTLMISIASALGIPGVNYPEGNFQHEWDEHQAFLVQIQSVVAKIMLNNDLVASTRSVRLASTTKAKIEGQLISLRNLVENSDMPASRRAKLISRLDDFAVELNQPRLNFASVALVASVFLAGIQGVTSTLADAPNAYQTVGTILKWIGQDKEAEDRERERLGPPAAMLPAPPQRTQAPSPIGGDAKELDDDIPF